ncbi:hypothetical protein DZC30_19590 [Comamonas testosteroni]|uniref:Uncharacterized protein n=1 Tax=Comamonas testosteroni TaxID=285 RepID=A0A373F9W6_COMTE|nr:hypothetical protein DZC30_19590 [Comamonas testosteroni]
MVDIQADEQIEMSADGSTVWVHALDGSTVGRFSKTFGIDVHRSATELLDGASQCLHCTHTRPDNADWLKFCELMLKHHGIEVDTSLIQI